MTFHFAANEEDKDVDESQLYYEQCITSGFKEWSRLVNS